MLKNLLFEHMELLFRPTNMFNPEFIVNCLKSRDSLPTVYSRELGRKTISICIFLIFKINKYFLFHIHTYNTTLFSIHYIFKRELKLSYPLRITKCKINSGLNEVHMAMENCLWAIPSEMCISNLISVVFLEEIKSLVSCPYCTFSLKLKHHTPSTFLHWTLHSPPSYFSLTHANSTH